MREEGALLSEVPEDVVVYDLGARSLWTVTGPLIRLLQTRPPDVVFATCGGMGVPAVLAARRAAFRGRIVLSERNGLVRDQPRWKSRLLVALKRRLFRQADLVTAVSDGVREDVVRRLHLPPLRVTTVYNPVVTPDLERRAAESLPPPWDEPGRRFVLAAGRLVPAKGFESLLRAFASLRGRDCALVILGEGPLRPRLEALASSLSIADDVALPGFDANPLRWMSRCSAFALSSEFEGLPGVLIQAMACGAPVVATDCPFGPAEIVADGRDGFLVPVGDEGALAGALGRALSLEPEARRRLGEAARASAERFRLDRILPLYEAAISGAPREV
jgi:glycosyltransferase involved in cell wall biosynthesis